MQLLLKRRFKGTTYTVGSLYVNGKYFCDTIEDTDRGLTDKMTLPEISRIKVKGVTAIPKGKYAIAMNIKSPKYSNFTKYPFARQYNALMPRLCNVKGYEGVLIHPGNTAKDTEGCILVGENKVKGQVINSLATWKKLMQTLLTDKNNITLTIE